MCEVCEFEQLNDIYVLNVFLIEVLIDVNGLKDFLEIKDDGFFFIYFFIFGVCSEMVMVLLRYDIMKFVCLEMKFYEQYFYFLLVFCMFIEKLEIMEYIL